MLFCLFTRMYFFFRDCERGSVWVAYTIIHFLGTGAVCVVLLAIILGANGIVDTTDGKEEIAISYDTWRYFSLVTWTTVGYGDVRPSKEARAYAAAEAAIGYLYMAMLAGMVLHVAPSIRKVVDDEDDSVCPYR
jgi:hypothetical protein